MERRSFLAVVLGRLASGAAAAASGPAAPRSRAGPVAPQADPASAVRRQFVVALDAGTSAALILFLTRYPDEADSGTARAALAAWRRPDSTPPGGPDGAIGAAFDRARLAGPAALAGFAAAYPNHPLGLEARRPFWRTGEP